MNKLRKTLFVFLIVSLVLLGGCAGDSSKLLAADTPETETAGAAPDQDGASSESTPHDQEETDPIFITFEGTDLDGNTVSQEIFSQSKLTMVNVWATYCNPCLSEMPGLGELAAEYDPAE
ncbi:MAG: TlpA family protein disulfide reductase, partial [Oscillibacter sp.]|nr:TlpA family protein disulfide reductase [Oscillibacter sp.]